MKRSLKILACLLVFAAIPSAMYFAGIKDAIPNPGKFEAFVPDPEAQRQVAKIIQEERLQFERILDDTGYMNYEAYKKLLVEEDTFPFRDSLGKSYVLTRSHVAFLKRIVFGSSFGDETKTITAIRNMKPAEWDFNPHWFLYGGSYLYLAAIFLKIAQVAGYIHLGDISFFILNSIYIQRIFLAIKFVNLVAFILGTALAYLLARRLVADDFRTGLFAAAFYATTPVFTYFIHVAKPYTISLTYTMAALWFLTRWVQGGLKRDFVLAAIAWGLSVGSNYFFVTYGIAFLIIYYWYRGSATLPSPSVKGDLVTAVKFALIGAVTFFAVNPYWIPSWREAFHEVFVQSGPRIVTHSDWINFLYFFLRPIYTIGIPGTILAYAFVTGGVLRRSLVATVAAVCFLFFGVWLSTMWNMKPWALLTQNDLGYGEHYDGFNAHPLLIFVIAEGLHRLGWRRPLTIVLAVLAIGYNVFYSGHTLARISSHEEMFHAAGDWIEANISEGETIMPAVLMEENWPEEARRFQGAQYPMPYFSIMRYNLKYPILSRDEIDSYPNTVICRSDYLDRFDAFRTQFRRVYAAGELGERERLLFFRHTMDYEPIYVYRRVGTGE